MTLPTPATVATTLTTDFVLVPHEVRHGSSGATVVATAPIDADTICVVFGGFVTPGPRFRSLPEHRRHHSLQIGDDLFLVCGEELTSGDFVNHSCSPNLAFVGEISLAALRPIAAGEELTFDYATCDSSPYDEFECECASTNCRGRVTGDDWRSPEIRARLAGRFSPYLQRRIDAEVSRPDR